MRVVVFLVFVTAVLGAEATLGDSFSTAVCVFTAIVTGLTAVCVTVKYYVENSRN